VNATQAMPKQDDQSSLASVGARLKAARGRQLGAESRKSQPSAMGHGMRAGVELIAAVMVGGGIGYGLDRWLDTRPVLLLIMLLLGITAGLTNIYRMTQGLDQSVGIGRAIREAETKENRQMEGKER